MPESLESVRWNTCVHRLDLGLYSHPEEFWLNGDRTHVNSKGKILSTGVSEKGPTSRITQDTAGCAIPAPERFVHNCLSIV